MGRAGKGVVIVDLETDAFPGDVGKRAAQVVAAHGFTLSIRLPDGTFRTLDGSFADDRTDGGDPMPTDAELLGDGFLTCELDARQIERMAKRQGPLAPAQDPAFYRRFERRGRDGRLRR